MEVVGGGTAARDGEQAAGGDEQGAVGFFLLGAHRAAGLTHTRRGQRSNSKILLIVAYAQLSSEIWVLERAQVVAKVSTSNQLGTRLL